MKEADLRRTVYKLDIKHSTKLVLLSLIQRVNWTTWSGPCSVQDICNDMNLKNRTVSRALEELVKIGFIKRSATIRESKSGKTYHHRAVNYIQVSKIMRTEGHVTHDSTNTEGHVTHDSTKTEGHVTHDSTSFVTDDKTRYVTDDKTRYVTDDRQYNKGLQQRITTKEDQQITEAQAEVIEELRASGMSEEVIARALKASKNLDKKLQYRRRQEARSTRVETSYNAYKPF